MEAECVSDIYFLRNPMANGIYFHATSDSTYNNCVVASIRLREQISDKMLYFDAALTMFTVL